MTIVKALRMCHGRDVHALLARSADRFVVESGIVMRPFKNTVPTKIAPPCMCIDEDPRGVLAMSPMPPNQQSDPFSHAVGLIIREVATERSN